MSSFNTETLEMFGQKMNKASNSIQLEIILADLKRTKRKSNLEKANFNKLKDALTRKLVVMQENESTGQSPLVFGYEELMFAMTHSTSVKRIWTLWKLTRSNKDHLTSYQISDLRKLAISETFYAMFRA